MIRALLIFFVTLHLPCYGTKKKIKTEPIFQRHIISVSVANAFSYGFYNGVNEPTNAIYTPFASAYIGVLRFTPSYAFVGSVGYSYGISKLWRLGMELEYILQGINYANGSQKTAAPYNSVYAIVGKSYTGSFMIPLHVIWKQHLDVGYLTLTLGPEFTLPLHVYSLYTNPNIPMRDKKYTITYPSSNTARFASMGFDVRLGYEIPIGKTISIDLGPIMSFNNLLQMHQTEGHDFYQGRQFFNYYAGLDVSFNFGLRKEKTNKPQSQRQQ